MTAEECALTVEASASYKELENPIIFASLVAKKFARYHVEKALESASKKSRIIDDPNSYTGNTGSEYPPDQIVDKKSILNAYPKENII